MKQGVFAAALAGALGFGSAQALAAPAPAEDAGRKCNPRGCQARCAAILGPLGAGFCLDDDCVCLF